jgi:hypothetical protein
MKHLKWPRPPLVLGFILGRVLERYMFISIQRYGNGWMWRPVVIVIFLMAFMSLARPFLHNMRAHGGPRKMLSDFSGFHLAPGNLFHLAMIALFAAMLAQTWDWPFQASAVPVIVGTGALLFCTMGLVNDIVSKPEPTPVALAAEAMQNPAGQIKTDKPIHMDIASHIAHMPVRIKLVRGALFFGWIVGFLLVMALIGLIPTVAIFVVAYMRLEGPERWSIVAPMAVLITLFVYVLFDQILAIPWPNTWIGNTFPALKIIPSV